LSLIILRQGIKLISTKRKFSKKSKKMTF